MTYAKLVHRLSNLQQLANATTLTIVAKQNIVGPAFDASPYVCVDKMIDAKKLHYLTISVDVPDAAAIDLPRVLEETHKQVERFPLDAATTISRYVRWSPDDFLREKNLKGVRSVKVCIKGDYHEMANCYPHGRAWLDAEIQHSAEQVQDLLVSIQPDEVRLWVSKPDVDAILSQGKQGSRDQLYDLAVYVQEERELNIDLGRLGTVRRMCDYGGEISEIIPMSALPYYQERMGNTLLGGEGSRLLSLSKSYNWFKRMRGRPAADMQQYVRSLKGADLGGTVIVMGELEPKPQATGWALPCHATLTGLTMYDGEDSMSVHMSPTLGGGRVGMTKGLALQGMLSLHEYLCDAVGVRCE